VRIDFRRHADQLRIEVQDWGAGFDPHCLPEGHFGLEGIQQRAKIFGGHATIRSTPGTGTHIIVELPLRGHGTA
jgi:signal transduction histidine kinase